MRCRKFGGAAISPDQPFDGVRLGRNQTVRSLRLISTILMRDYDAVRPMTAFHAFAARGQSFINPTPIAIAIADAHRQPRTGSRKTNAAMTTANRMLDSRKAATSAMGACVNAHMAIQ